MQETTYPSRQTPLAACYRQSFCDQNRRPQPIDWWCYHYRYLVPFKCVIEPRSSAALALIQRSESNL